MTILASMYSTMIYLEFPFFGEGESLTWVSIKYSLIKWIEQFSPWFYFVVSFSNSYSSKFILIEIKISVPTCFLFSFIWVTYPNPLLYDNNYPDVEVWFLVATEEWTYFPIHSAIMTSELDAMNFREWDRIVNMEFRRKKDKEEMLKLNLLNYRCKKW